MVKSNEKHSICVTGELALSYNEHGWNTDQNMVVKLV